MPRGGHRENSGRKPAWLSSNVTRAIRVPEPLADRILEIARTLDQGEEIEIVQNQSLLANSSSKLEQIKEIVEFWQTEVQKSKSSSVKAKILSNAIREINAIIN